MKNLNSFEGERVKLDRKKAIVCYTAVEQFFLTLLLDFPL